MYPTYQLPSPLDVCRGMMELWGEGVIWEHIRVSLFRFSVAYFLAAASGIFLGLLFGWHIRLHAAFDPFVQMLRPISPIAWFPLAILWFKVGDPPAIFIIYLAAFFPILLTTIAAVRSVEHIYLQVALNFGTRERDILTKIIIPAAFPQIMVGLHLALGSAWIHLVAGEMLGAQSGLGFLIIDARNFLRTDWIISGMIFIGLLGLALDKCMGWMEKRINLLWGHVMKN
ncbi:MAG: ABC transporter permease [Dethiobacter sp.]|nr:MAG: ABC transporter permease [Dethiobacter sp.]